MVATSGLLLNDDLGDLIIVGNGTYRVGTRVNKAFVE